MPGISFQRTALITAFLCLHWIVMPYATQLTTSFAMLVEIEHQEQEPNAEETWLELDESILAALLTSWTFKHLKNNVDVHRVPAWDRLLDGTLLDPPEQHA